MLCIPFLYGVGAGVATVRGGLPPQDLFMLSARGCPPSQPQQPPLQPPHPPPGPPPSRVYVETRYILSFPPFVGVNVKVFWDALDDYILPSSKPIALQWQYYPTTYVQPRILATTKNPAIHTQLRPFVDVLGRVYVDIDSWPYTDYYKRYSYFLVVWQFLFHNERWIVVVHEVDLPRGLYAGWTWQGGATPTDYHVALQNRKERLVLFYDSALQGLGSFTYRSTTIYLTPTVAFIGSINNPGDPEYYIQPTNNPAYCMYIEVRRKNIRL